PRTAGSHTDQAVGADGRQDPAVPRNRFCEHAPGERHWTVLVWRGVRRIVSAAPVTGGHLCFELAWLGTAGVDRVADTDASHAAGAVCDVAVDHSVWVRFRAREPAASDSRAGATGSAHVFPADSAGRDPQG